MLRDDDIEAAGESRRNAGLGYHLNELYGLRPLPEDFLRLIREVERRLNSDAS